MGLFSNYRHLYLEPERFTPDEARQRRLLSTLERERKALEVRPARLSPANQFHLNQLKEFEAKFGAELEARRARARQVAVRDPSIERSGTYKAVMSRLFQLEQRRSALLQRAAAERRANGLNKAIASDNRQFSFMDKMLPRTVFGTSAWLKLHGADAMTVRVFRSPHLAIPCIQRVMRREVMFATKKAGRAHRGKRKFNALSYIGC